MKRWIAFALLACALFLIAAEIALRRIGLGDPPIAVRDAELEYRLVPNARYERWGNRIDINRHGFRAPDHSTGVPDGETRLLLIGDSVVYGNHFLDQEETIALRLSAALSLPDCTVRVIPMAVSSWGPVNQAAALARHGTFGATEIAIVLSAHDLVDTPTYNGALIPYRLSKPKGAIGDAVEAILERRFPAAPKETAEPFETRAKASLNALNSIRERALAENANLTVIYHPTTDERISGMSDQGRRLVDWARQQGIGVLDLGATPDITYRDNIHPDAAGAAGIANALADEYRSKLVCDTKG
ncbi:hypothetical protein AB9K34_14940 [Sedimentitalea sp. XS_ASV28]|uniref:hypothetical protein n=1 Tax=Sedimentitalea sp. XS_ASV28 TaxID=3241296 RepID=UPI003511C7A4